MIMSCQRATLQTLKLQTQTVVLWTSNIFMWTGLLRWGAGLPKFFLILGWFGSAGEDNAAQKVKFFIKDFFSKCD